MKILVKVRLTDQQGTVALNVDRIKVIRPKGENYSLVFLHDREEPFLVWENFDELVEKLNTETELGGNPTS